MLEVNDDIFERVAAQLSRLGLEDFDLTLTVTALLEVCGESSLLLYKTSGTHAVRFDAFALLLTLDGRVEASPEINPRDAISYVISKKELRIPEHLHRLIYLPKKIVIPKDLIKNRYQSPKAFSLSQTETKEFKAIQKFLNAPDKIQGVDMSGLRR